MMILPFCCILYVQYFRRFKMFYSFTYKGHALARRDNYSHSYVRSCVFEVRRLSFDSHSHETRYSMSTRMFFRACKESSLFSSSSCSILSYLLLPTFFLLYLFLFFFLSFFCSFYLSFFQFSFSILHTVFLVNRIFNSSRNFFFIFFLLYILFIFIFSDRIIFFFLHLLLLYIDQTKGCSFILI